MTPPLRDLTVVGYYSDQVHENNYYACWFAAEDSAHAIKQARNEVGEYAAETLVVVGVFEGRCALAPDSP